MMSGQYLTFSIHGEEYAVSILRVREIIEYEFVTPVPATPGHIRGVIDLRGAVVPVIDLAVRFGHAEAAPGRTTCVVILEAALDEAMVTVGLVADAVSEVIDLSDDQIEEAPAFGAGIEVPFLAGIARIEKRLALILNPDRLLTPIELTHALEITSENSSELLTAG